MKTFRFSFLPILLAAVLWGCTDNACKDVNCGDHGTCEEGACICEAGYITDANGQCTIRLAETIAGVYQAQVQGCNTGSYDVTLQPGNVFDEVLIIANLGGYTCDNGQNVVVEATILDATHFELMRGPYCNQYQLEGTGTITDTEIEIDYTAEYEAPLGSGNLVVESCTVTLAR